MKTAVQKLFGSLVNGSELAASNAVSELLYK